MIYRLFKILLLFCILASCNRNTYVMAPQPSAANAEVMMQMPDSLNTKFDNGVDYYASGNEPIPWQLSMDFEGQFSFATAGNNLSLIARPGVPTNIGTTFTLQDAAGSMTINLLTAYCAGTKNLQTIAKVNNRLYRGCGQYLYDRNLEGKWQLSKIKNKAIENSDYPKQIPQIIFNTLHSSLSINSSCNKMLFTYSVSGNKLSIPAYTSNNNKCNGKFEDILNTSFYGKVCSYYVKENTLILYLIDDSIIEFVKDR